MKAGMLKCAVDVKGLTPGVERVLRAVAQAHVQTSTPVTIHTHAAGQHGQAILDLLCDEGADLARVVLGHSGDSTDPDYLQRNWHYLHISQDVLPYLLAHGVTQDQIDQMLIRTPARILACAAAASGSQ